MNLYPTNQSFSGNFSLKFDVWVNWTNLSFSTEHVLCGINHSGVGRDHREGLAEDSFDIRIGHLVQNHLRPAREQDFNRLLGLFFRQ